jgi:phage shock protein PspC (stress-responsive transcriptional regulator)
MIAGVCGGIAEYFGIDPVIVRVIAVALVFAGGAGLLAYLAAWLLVPEHGADPDTGAGPGRVATIAGAVLLVCAIGALLPFWGGPFGGWHFGGFFVFLVFLGLAGLGVWWLASGEGSSGGASDIVRRSGLGLALLAVCGLLAIAGAWATAAGGGVVVAIVVIVAGVWLLTGAFVGGARWLILPALALALPAGVVAAAGIDIDGGIGEREYRPTAAAQVRDTYRLGVGRLVVDLRDAQLPPGDRRLNVDVGVGEVVIAVPPDVCVTSTARLGAGEVGVFDRDAGGIDVDWLDDRSALPGTTRLVLDADIGLGALHVGYDDPDQVGEHGFVERTIDDPNRACIGGRRG